MMTQAPEPECVLTNRRPPAHDLGCTGIGDKKNAAQTVAPCCRFDEMARRRRLLSDSGQLAQWGTFNGPLGAGFTAAAAAPAAAPAAASAAAAAAAPPAAVGIRHPWTQTDWFDEWVSPPHAVPPHGSTRHYFHFFFAVLRDPSFAPQCAAAQARSFGPSSRCGTASSSRARRRCRSLASACPVTVL